MAMRQTHAARTGQWRTQARESGRAPLLVQFALHAGQAGGGKFMRFAGNHPSLRRRKSQHFENLVLDAPRASPTLGDRDDAIEPRKGRGGRFEVGSGA